MQDKSPRAGKKKPDLRAKKNSAELQANREARWRAENREAIESVNRYIEKHGLPLAKYRSW